MYRNSIKKYIMSLFKMGGNISGAPKFDIEGKSTIMGISCIRHMLGFFDVDVRNMGESRLIVSSKYQENKKYGSIMMMYEQYNYGNDNYEYYVNGYMLGVPNKVGCKCRALLLFLTDPLEFIKRNIQEITTLNDSSVKSLLLELQICAKNMEVMHIKYWLAINMGLNNDVGKVVVDQYIDLVFNRVMVREGLLGDEKLKI